MVGDFMLQSDSGSYRKVFNVFGNIQIFTILEGESIHSCQSKSLELLKMRPNWLLYGVSFFTKL